MLPYWVLFSVFGIGAVLSRGSRRPGVSILLVAVLAFTILLIGFRYQVGGDWYNYQRTYAKIGSIGLVPSLRLRDSDPAYSLINWVGQSIGAEIWFVNLVCGGIFIWGLSRLAAQQPAPWLFFVVTTPYCLVVVGMGYTRQSVAIGLCAAALASFSKHGTKRSVAYVIAGALFHKSAILMLPLVAMSDQKNRFLSIMLGLLLVGLLYYFLLAANSDRLYENYVGASMQSRGATVRVLMTAFPAVLFLLFPARFGFDARDLALARIMSYACIGSAVALALVPSSTAVDRLALYLIPFQAVILARFSWAFSKKASDFAMAAMIVAYSAAVLFVWLNYADNAFAWIPYRLFPFA